MSWGCRRSFGLLCASLTGCRAVGEGQAMAMRRRTKGKLTARPSLPDDSAFTIAAEVGFDAAGVWVIRVTARYRDGVPAEGSDLRAEARVGAVLAIIRAG